MRLKLDENMPMLLATTLRSAGHDVHAAADESLLGRPDDEVWAATRREGRLLVALDRDFGRLASQGGDHVGAIVLPPRDAEQTAIVSLAMRALQLAAEIDMKNRVAIVDDERVRIRPPLAIIPSQEST